MIIITADGPRSFYTPTYKIPAAIVEAERVWRSAWNTGVQEFNILLERTQDNYKRMMDVKPLQMIPDNETRIPGLVYPSKD
jgi:hypothetical protein